MNMFKLSSSLSKTVIGLIFIVCLVSLTIASQVKENLNQNILTKEELEYIKNHPIIKVPCVADSAPYNFVKDGKGYGYSIDHIRLVASKVGLHNEPLFQDQ